MYNWVASRLEEKGVDTYNLSYYYCGEKRIVGYQSPDSRLVYIDVSDIQVEECIEQVFNYELDRKKSYYVVWEIYTNWGTYDTGTHGYYKFENKLKELYVLLVTEDLVYPNSDLIYVKNGENIKCTLPVELTSHVESMIRDQNQA